MAWSSLGYMEDGPRSNFGCVNINSHQALILGGQIHLDGVKKCDIWDMETKKWSVGPSLPITMRYCRATFLDGYVYVIGTYADFYRLKIQRMDLGWQRLPVAKVDGLGCELVSDEKYIYRIGDNFKQASMQRYDPRKHIWQPLPKMEEGRYFLGAAIAKGKIYVTGGKTGYSGDKALSSVSIYDISRKQWRTGPELPVSLYNHSAVAIKNFILVTGGQQICGSRALTTCFILNIETRNWTQLDTTLPQGFSGHSVIANGWNVALIGGTSGTNDDKDKTIFGSEIFPLLFQKRRQQTDVGSKHSSASRQRQRPSVKSKSDSTISSTSRRKSGCSISTDSTSISAKKAHQGRPRNKSRVLSKITSYFS